ncbi:MAG: HEPN domain-containing protein [Chloroflexi bacterium]|nr:HEPN domain-containing protein [Chloroflexota bacterium]
MPDRSADWLAQAERDLEVARHLLEGGFYEWACFVAQQAAEKAVKALYQHLHGEAWGHAVTVLLESLPEEHHPPADLVEKAKALDRYYIQPRYPNGFERGAPKDYYTRKDAEAAVSDAQAILAFCASKIS